MQLHNNRQENPRSLLVNHFLEKAASALGKPVPSVPLALYQLLKTYSFPGNVRELEALVGASGYLAFTRCAL
jgi:DNA-binding NtrC family response regulator